jgi:hypothetical protein
LQNISTIIYEIMKKVIQNGLKDVWYFELKNYIKKNAYLLIIILLSVYQLNAQVPPLNNAVQVWPDFDQANGRLSFYSHNIDFCDYYVHISFVDFDGFEGMTSSGISAIVSPGKRQFRTYRTRTGATNHRYRFYYNIYRGSSIKKPNTDFIYALPIVAGDMVTATVRGGAEPESYQMVFELPSDTVYACRGGVMCDDNLKAVYRSYSPTDLSQITLYHDDKSFSGYIFKGKSLVAPGEKIKIGSPIAVVERDSDKYSVCFSTYFLDRNKLKNNLPWKHTHFLPFFQTSNEGKTQLKNGEIYTCELTQTKCECRR